MINSVIVLGNLTKDPVQRETTNNNVVTSFSIAVNGIKDHTDFFNVQTWGKTAEFVAKYLKKGSQVVVDGRLSKQIWEKDGEKHYDVIIVADNVQSTYSKSEGNKGTKTELLEQVKDNLPTDEEVDNFDPNTFDPSTIHFSG